MTSTKPSSARETGVAWSSGMLFGVGLAWSGMTDPEKVKAFLDWTGDWNPALAFVMGSALLVSAISVRLARPSPPASGVRARVDGRLVVGACLFGVGWGMRGLCPGPAIASLGTATPSLLLFVLSMLVGMAVFEAFDVRLAGRKE